MPYTYLNLNPKKKKVGDCVVRALALVMGQSWEDVYTDLTMVGFDLCDMPNANPVWDRYLTLNGYTRKHLPNTCPDCYTVRDFCREHPTGRYVLGTGTHALAVIDGVYYDTWDTGDLVPVVYWEAKR